MQSHYWIDNLNDDDVDATIARFVKAGVKVSITELDIPYGSYSNQHTTPLTKDEEIVQARLYAQLFEVYKKYASSIERITFWGKADSQSWRAKGSPLLFDKTFAAKQSYYAVIDPQGYLLSIWKNPYSDVIADGWFYADAAYVSMNKLIDDTSLTTFSPQTVVTWGQFLTTLYRLYGQLGASADKLRNVAADDWAVDNGLVEAGFRSDKLLSRQDMAVIIEKYLEYSSNTLPFSATQHTYADDVAIDAKAKPAVELLYKMGIIIGKSGNRFDPAGHTSRAEIAVVLHRLAKTIEAANAY